MTIPLIIPPWLGRMAHEQGAEFPLKGCVVTARAFSLGEPCPDCNGTGVEHHPDYPTCETCKGCGLAEKKKRKKSLKRGGKQ